MKVIALLIGPLCTTSAFLFPHSPSRSETLVKRFNQFGKIEPIPPGSQSIGGALESNPQEPWFPDAIATVVPTQVSTALYDKEGRMSGVENADTSFGMEEIAIAEAAAALEKAAKEQEKKEKAAAKKKAEARKEKEEKKE